MEPTDIAKIDAVSIAGRVGRERERLIGMTDEERAWRARFVKSQELAPDEPIKPKGYDKLYYNPLRRFYRAPLNKVENALTPLLGEAAAIIVRNIIGRSIIGIFVIYGSWYYLKYNHATWMRQSGWRIMSSRPRVYPGTKDFPNFKAPMKPNEYATFGFENSPI